MYCAVCMEHVLWLIQSREYLQWNQFYKADTPGHTDEIQQSSILYAWTFLAKGLCWYSSVQRTSAFELPKACESVVTDSHTHAQAQEPYENTHTVHRPLKEELIPFIPNLLLPSYSQNTMAKHPAGRTFDYDIFLFHPFFLTSLAMGEV